VYRIDVTNENIVITSGTHSNAAEVVLFDIKGERMITVDRIDDKFTQPRDTIRIWKYEGDKWMQETYITRSHVGTITNVMLIR
jgi:hypothetical protein